MSEWFTANKFSLNLHDTNIIKFTTNNAFIKTEDDVKYMEEPVNTNLLGIHYINTWTRTTIQIKRLLTQMQQVMYLALCFTSATLTLFREFFCLFSLYNKIWNNSEGNMSSSKKIFTPQKNIFSFIMVENLWNSGGGQEMEILLFHVNTYFYETYGMLASVLCTDL